MEYSSLKYLLCKPKNLEEAKKMVGESVTNL